MWRRDRKHPHLERIGIGGQVLDWLTSRSPRAMGWSVVAVIVLGTAGFWLVSKLDADAQDIDLIEALYMAVITVSTVGYGDLVGTRAEYIFATIYIIIGVAVVSLTISTLAAALVAGRISEVFGRRRMERQIRSLKDHLILCGFGRIGQITGRQVHAKGVPLVVIDTDSSRIDEADEDGMLGIVHDATEEEALRKANIETARAILCSLPSDADNVYTILSARELRKDILIVAMSRAPGADRKLRVAGADHVVSPYTIGARHMAREILSPNLARVMNLATNEPDEEGGVQLEEFPLERGSPLIGQALKESPIRRDFGVMLVAVVDADGQQHFNPGPDLVMGDGAVLVAIGPPEGLGKLADICSPPVGSPE